MQCCLLRAADDIFKVCKSGVVWRICLPNLIWLLAIVSVQLSGAPLLVYAETYYQQVRVRSPNLIIGVSKDACVKSCLTSVSCSAVSVCDSPTPLCFLQYCANIQLVSAAACTTIVLAEIQVIEGVNVPAPVHEWMLTDSCGLTFVNTAAVYAPAMTVGSGETTSYTPTSSVFFGNSLTSSNFNVRANQVKIDFSQSFSVTFWLKSFIDVTALTIAKITYTQGSITYYLLVNYDVNNVKITTNLQNFTSTGQNFTVSVGQWHFFAFVYDASGAMQVFFDSQRVFSATAGSALSSSSTPLATILSGRLSNGGSYSIYCYKIFNVPLTLPVIELIAKSCLVGKITTASIGCAPSNLVYNGKYYYLNQQMPNITGAFSLCESLGQQLMKMDDLAELTYLTNKLGYSPSGFWWTSLYGIGNTFTWLSDGSTLLKSSLPASAWWIDECCYGPPWCFVVTVGRTDLGEYGCNQPNFGGLVCTCKAT